MLSNREYNQVIISLSLVETITLDGVKKILRAFTDFNGQPVESFDVDQTTAIIRRAGAYKKDVSLEDFDDDADADDDAIDELFNTPQGSSYSSKRKVGVVGINGIDYANFYRRHGTKIKELVADLFEGVSASELKEIRKEVADCYLKNRPPRIGAPWGSDTNIITELLERLGLPSKTAAHTKRSESDVRQ